MAKGAMWKLSLLAVLSGILTGPLLSGPDFFNLNARVWAAEEDSDKAGETQEKGSWQGAGLHVEFLARPEDKDAGFTVKTNKSIRLGFRMTDSQSGYGISDLHPAGWVFRRSEGKPRPDPETCESDIKKFARGGLSVGVGTEGNLNNYYIITLNQDNSVAILNPSVNLATSNLLALIPLEGKTKKWYFDEQYGRIYVTMPEDDQVAVVDMFARKLESHIKVGSRPAEIALVPDSQYILIGNDRSGTVSFIDRAQRKMTRNVRVGTGPLSFAFDPLLHLIFVVSAKEGRITIIDSLSLKKVKTLSIEPGDIRFAYSPLSQALYVAYRKNGTLKILFRKDGKELKTLQGASGISKLRVTPDGRFVFVINESKNIVEVIDASTNRVAHHFNTWDQPYHVEFSDTFAYIRYKGSPNVSLIQLSALADSKAPPFADVPLGIQGPGKLADELDDSPIAIFPEGGGALVVDPLDKTIYFYMESGMLAPSNSFKTYTAPPLGVFIYDHRLRESATAGLYETTTRFEQGGTYNVYFLLPSPLVATCFELKVEGPYNKKEKKGPPGMFLSLFKEAEFCTETVSKVRFKLLSTKTRKPMLEVKGVRVFSFLKSGFWQVRKWAKSIGDGIYEAEFVFPKAGKYHVLVEAPGLGIRFEDTDITFAHVLQKESVKDSKHKESRQCSKSVASG